MPLEVCCNKEQSLPENGLFLDKALKWKLFLLWLNCSKNVLTIFPNYIFLYSNQHSHIQDIFFLENCATENCEEI